MHKLYKTKKVPIAGNTPWRNPTNHKLRIRYMNDGGGWEVKTVEPRGTVALPKAWTDKVVKSVAPALVRADAPDPPSEPAIEVDESPTEALGDATQPRTVTEDSGVESDSERSSGDALEAHAAGLCDRHSYADLQTMAIDLGVASGGRKLDVARRIAKKAAE